MQKLMRAICYNTSYNLATEERKKEKPKRKTKLHCNP